MHLQEKFRPRDWNELIGLDNSKIGSTTQKEILINLAETGRARILIFYGPPGTGKTSAARIFASKWLEVPYKEIESKAIDGTGCADYLEINAGINRTMDFIRSIKEGYIVTKPSGDKAKILMIDEADGLPSTTQQIFKSDMEHYAFNCIFILCLNNLSKIDDALLSRASVFKFNKIDNEIVNDWFIQKCKECDINIGENTAKSVVLHYDGDMRRITNDFLTLYEGQTITTWQPKKTYADEIFNAKDKAKTYLDLASKKYIDPDALLHDLLILNGFKNVKAFGEASLIQDPMIKILYILEDIT